MKPELEHVTDSNGQFLIVSKATADEFDYDKKIKMVTPDMLEKMREREKERLNARKAKLASVSSRLVLDAVTIVPSMDGGEEISQSDQI